MAATAAAVLISLRLVLYLTIILAVLATRSAVANPAAEGLEHVDEAGAEELAVIWCVPKASLSGAALQSLLDYACSQGADCSPVQPGGHCFVPDTLYAHAAFAINDYWQRQRANGATCDFQGGAVLVTQDPSDGECTSAGGEIL